MNQRCDQEHLIEFYNHNAACQKPPHVLGLTTVNDVQSRSKLPWLPLRLPFSLPYGSILEEARNLRSRFLPYRTKEHHHGWSSLCLHGPSMGRYDWTEIAAACPITVAFFSDIFDYDRYFRIRFMLLEAGGFIMPHHDAEVDRLDAMNMALNNPVNCHFVMEGAGIIPFQDGTTMLLSLARRHVVWNQSGEDRYHMIISGVRGRAWNEIIMDSYSRA